MRRRRSPRFFPVSNSAFGCMAGLSKVEAGGSNATKAHVTSVMERSFSAPDFVALAKLPQTLFATRPTPARTARR